MKYAILLAFAAFAFLAQANARTIVDKSVDRGAIAEALKRKLAAAREKLDLLLDKASDMLKEKITEVQKKAELLIDELKHKANKFSDKVYVAADKIITQAGYLEDAVEFFNSFRNKETETTTQSVESY